MIKLIILLKFMFALSIITFYCNKNSPAIYWCALIPFCCGLGNLAVIIHLYIIPELEATSLFPILREFMNSFGYMLLFISHHIPPYLFLNFSVSYSFYKND